jgi:hypothetical protein
VIIENKGANTPFIFYKILFKDILEIFDKLLSFSTYTRNFLIFLYLFTYNYFL